MEGWISLHRKIKDHWIWKSQKRFQWWVDVLLTVNHSDGKVLIGGTLFDCNRGQSVRSLETWAKDWNVTKKTVRDFFILLQNDNMISLENIKVSTRITVCNYDSYQIVVNDKETQSKRKVNDKETASKRELPPNNNNNKKNNDNNKNKEEAKIPEFSIFQKYALEKKSNLDLESLKFKYESWVVNGWKDGYGNSIKNWKTKLLNTIPHLKVKENGQPERKPRYKQL